MVEEHLGWLATKYVLSLARAETVNAAAKTESSMVGVERVFVRAAEFLKIN